MKTTIELDKHTVMIKREENGVSSVKHTTPDLLKQALSVSEFSETPFFPTGHGVAKYMVKGNTEVYFYVTPPKRIEVTYDTGDGPETYNIETPHMLFTMRFIKESASTKRLVASSVYGLRQAAMTLQTQIYRLPFPNIYDQPRTNPICWGGYTPVFGGDESIASIFTQFFLAPFNGDLNPYLNIDEDGDPESLNMDGYESRMSRGTHLLPYMDHMITNESHPGEFKFPTSLLTRERGTIREMIDFERREIHNV